MKLMVQAPTEEQPHQEIPIPGRRDTKLMLRNLGPGEIYFDLTPPKAPEASEPEEGEESEKPETPTLEEVGFVLGVGESVTLGVPDCLYVAAGEDDTDLRYAVVG